MLELHQWMTGYYTNRAYDSSADSEDVTTSLTVAISLSIYKDSLQLPPKQCLDRDLAS